MEQSSVPPEVQAEFDESLDADIDRWKAAIRKSIERYEAAQAAKDKQ